MHPTVTADATQGQRPRRRSATLCGALGAVVLLAACAEQPRPAPVVYRGTDPATASPPPAPATQTAALPAPTTDGRGVVDYGGFSAIVARPGDSVASMAARVGVSESALASYNGLPANHTPRPGDELILPPEATVPQAARIETAPLPAPGAPSTPAPETAAPPPAFDLASIEASLAPETAAGATSPPPDAAAPSAPQTRAPGQSVPDQSVPGQSVPGQPAPAEPQPAVRFEPAPDPAATATTQQQTAAVAPPAPVAPAPPAAATAAGVLTAPVDGSIARRFSSGGAGPRNDGVDFAAPAGATVSAAGDGQVALISESLGGLGTIVLIRHQGDLLTVYGRVQDVTVAKGDRVRRGQPIGAVAPAPDGGDASLHFEVRRGAQSVDPEDYLAG